MARIVIAHQSVLGPDEIYDAYIIGRALVTRGHHVLYISDDVGGIYQLTGPDARLEAWQVILPPELTTKSVTSSQLRGYGDKLAEIGFSDPVRLRALMNAWTTQLRRAKPDVVVAVAAPVAWLVGPHIGPTLAVGSGAALPVSTDSGFIEASDDASSAVESSVLETNINFALAELGFERIDSLTKILERCEQWHYGLDWLDPYLPYRQSPSVGMLGAMPPDGGGPTEARLSIFLDVHHPNVANILLAIASLVGLKIDLFVKGATMAMQNFLSAQPEVSLWDRFDSAVAQAPKASAIIHHGAPMIAMLGIAAGRPHLVLPWTSEQMTVLEMLEEQGVAWWKGTNFSLAEIGQTLRALLKDQSILNRALHHRTKLAEEGTDNALLTISAAVEAAAAKHLRVTDLPPPRDQLQPAANAAALALPLQEVIPASQTS